MYMYILFYRRRHVYVFALSRRDVQRQKTARSSWIVWNGTFGMISSAFHRFRAEKKGWSGGI